MKKISRKLQRATKPVIRDLFDDSDAYVDLFAGGGGASAGTEDATGEPVTVAINHDKTAIAVHKVNHPATEHYREDIFKVKPRDAVRGRRVRHLHASPDCKDFSRAKGGKPKNKKIRALAWVVHRWVADLKPTNQHPEVITLENVPEFPDWGPLYPKGTIKLVKVRGKLVKKDVGDKRIPERKGETFRRWVAHLESQGYVVEWRVLHAHHYGAPTSRKRLFLVARRDGKPIVWPAPTHGPGLLPFHSAAECIDWSIPCRSIFGRKKPLAVNTLKRIAAGIMKFILNNPRPFIVTIDNQSNGVGHAAGDVPLSTITSKARHLIVAPSLIQTGYGEREGQAPRVLQLERPLGTIMADGQKHALVAAFLAQHNQGEIGQPLTKPMPTVTAIDSKSLVTSSLLVLRNNCDATSLDAPVPTVAAEGQHIGLIAAFLSAYYGGANSPDVGQELSDPMRTVVTHDRFAVVTLVIDGITYAITDICMRMLTPRELLRAQFGRFAAGYDLSAAKTTRDQVRLIGNSVCPEVQSAVVRANLGPPTPIRKTPPRRAAAVRRAA